MSRKDAGLRNRNIIRLASFPSSLNSDFMNEVKLIIQSAADSQELTLADGRMSLGRGDVANVRLNDNGLSRLHASVCREGNRVWIVDEGSTNGSFVNGQQVSSSGMALNDGDRISIGDYTRIQVSIKRAQTAVSTQSPESVKSDSATNVSGNTSRLPLIAGVSVIVLIVIAVVGVGASLISKNRKKSKPEIAKVEPTNSDKSQNDQPSEIVTPTPEPSITPLVIVPPENVQVSSSFDQQSVAGDARKAYLKMSPEEQRDFVIKQGQRIAIMIGNRPTPFTDDAIDKIKYWVDAYARRVGNGSTKMWGEDLRTLFKRASTYTPPIIRAFKSRGVPPVVGVYLPMIETEYHNIASENFAGAAGLFQFIAPTAKAYGVEPSERTNVSKMAPAAAAYISDRLAEFGPDAVGVGLSIAGYNRSPDSIRRDLHDVINSDNRERSFWTLISNKEKLDHYFQNENINYVPRFFAFAIIGENPWAFGLDMAPLSTYTEETTPANLQATDQQ